MVKSIVTITFLIIGMINGESLKAQIKIGVFADCQYCNCETAGKRYYRNSLQKLNECILAFNQNKKIGFVVGLGDLIDRNLASFDSVNQILNTSRKDIFHVAGNHDFEVEKADFDKVGEKLGFQESYYSFSKKGWKFIFLNGNEITYNSNDPEIVKQAEKLVNRLVLEKKPNAAKWNGGMSETQISWLENELKNAEKNQIKVILFCHYPLLPLEAHSLWNSEQVLPVLEKYNCVKAWINGHNHAGNYALQNGIHFINLKGMVDTENENAYSIISLSSDNIEIEGFGREISRSFQVKQIRSK